MAYIEAASEAFVTDKEDSDCNQADMDMENGTHMGMVPDGSFEVFDVAQ